MYALCKILFFKLSNKAGTGSTLTSAIKTGSASSFFGLLDHGKKKIERFLVSTFDDNIKQKGIDVIIGRTN